jgi:hypothetical protein
MGKRPPSFSISSAQARDGPRRVDPHPVRQPRQEERAGAEALQVEIERPEAYVVEVVDVETQGAARPAIDAEVFQM